MGKRLMSLLAPITTIAPPLKQPPIGAGINFKLVFIAHRQNIQPIAATELEFSDRLVMEFFGNHQFHNAVFRVEVKAIQN